MSRADHVGACPATNKSPFGPGVDFLVAEIEEGQGISPPVTECEYAEDEVHGPYYRPLMGLGWPSRRTVNSMVKQCRSRNREQRSFSQCSCCARKNCRKAPNGSLSLNSMATGPSPSNPAAKFVFAPATTTTLMRAIPAL